MRLRTCSFQEQEPLCCLLDAKISFGAKLAQQGAELAASNGGRRTAGDGLSSTSMAHHPSAHSNAFSASSVGALIKRMIVVTTKQGRAAVRCLYQAERGEPLDCAYVPCSARRRSALEPLPWSAAAGQAGGYGS